MRDEKKNVVVDLSLKFSLRVIEYTELLETHKKYVITKQLLRSGTAIGALVREAQNAESKADFIHKFKIAAKEADETEYWLELCREAKSYPDHNGLFGDLHVLIKIISKIIGTSKRR